MSVRVWRHPDPDNNALRIEFDDGDGGVYELADGDAELVETDHVPADWVELVPRPEVAD